MIEVTRVPVPETKNGNSRDVPLSTAAVDVLAVLLPKEKGKRKLRKVLAVPPELRGPVFAVHPDDITQAFERALR